MDIAGPLRCCFITAIIKKKVPRVQINDKPLTSGFVDERAIRNIRTGTLTTKVFSFMNFAYPLVLPRREWPKITRMGKA